MSATRDPDTILAAWLDEGPTDLPDVTRRAIVTALPTTSQARRGPFAPWRLFPMNATTRLAMGALVAVIAVGGALYLLGPSRYGSGGPALTPSPVPSPQPSASAFAVPPLTQQFTSTLYGYSIRYPAGWIAAPGSVLFDPVPFASAGGPSEWIDTFVPGAGSGLLRIASARVPDGVVAETWIDETYMECLAACQATLEDTVIGGQPAKLRDAGDGELEATAIIDGRAYVFTLFQGQADGLTEPRAWFDAFLATVEFHPENAAPSAIPS
jgi:hypothetical protein